MSFVTLDSKHIYEIKQDSEWYKNYIVHKDSIKKLFKIMNTEYFKDKGFALWHSEYFGVRADSADYETYKTEVLKKPVQDTYIFSKRSKYFKLFKEIIESTLVEEDVFAFHDNFGLNNAIGSHMIDGRWFVGVKNPKFIKSFTEIDEVKSSEYLELVLNAIKKEEEKGNN